MSIISEKCLWNVKDMLDLREVTSGFGVLGLLFVEVSGEGDDLCVDRLIADGAALSISRHDCGIYEVVRCRESWW